MLLKLSVLFSLCCQDWNCVELFSLLSFYGKIWIYFRYKVTFLLLVLNLYWLFLICNTKTIPHMTVVNFNSQAIQNVTSLVELWNIALTISKIWICMYYSDFRRLVSATILSHRYLVCLFCLLFHVYKVIVT